jgi:hypothetical protein
LELTVEDWTQPWSSYRSASRWRREPPSERRREASAARGFQQTADSVSTVTDRSPSQGHTESCQQSHIGNGHGIRRAVEWPSLIGRRARMTASVGSATGGRLTRQCGAPTAVDGSPACTWPEVAGCIGRIKLRHEFAAGTGRPLRTSPPEVRSGSTSQTTLGFPGVEPSGSVTIVTDRREAGAHHRRSRISQQGFPRASERTVDHA